MIHWKDGVEYAPDGEHLREVVQPNVWTSSVWVSQSGASYRKYWNMVTKKWSPFESMFISFDQDTQTRIGIKLPSGWMSTEMTIATGWLHRAPGSGARVQIFDPSSVHLRTIAWGGQERNPENGCFDDETWKRLSWDCGAVKCTGEYWISSHGRLKNPKGDITSGFAAKGSRWAAVKGCGLVNLLQASCVLKATKRVPKRLYDAFISISNGVQAEEHAMRYNISTKLAWDYYNHSVPLLQNDKKRFGKKLVPSDLWRVLEEMRGNPILGGKLLDLHPIVTHHLGTDISFDELRFARACIV